MANLMTSGKMPGGKLPIDKQTCRVAKPRLMKLAAYLNREQISPSAFAETLGVAPSTITRLIKGEREPGLKLALAIRDKTRGDVTPDDLVVGDAAAFPPSVASGDTSPPEGVADGRQEGARLPTADCRMPAVDGRAVAEAAE